MPKTWQNALIMIEQQLTELKSLHDQGLISPDVYAERQREILAGKNTAPPPVSKEVAKQSSFGKTLLIIALVLGAGWGAYKLSDQGTKDVVHALALESGVAAKLVPWPDRAEPVLRPFMSSNAGKIAGAIQAITHPSGKDPDLEEFDIAKLSDRVQVTIKITWKGGVIGTQYQTVVIWELAESGHVSATVLYDTALTHVAEQNKEQLDTFFGSKVYPAAYRSIEAK